MHCGHFPTPIFCVQAQIWNLQSTNWYIGHSVSSTYLYRDMSFEVMTVYPTLPKQPLLELGHNFITPRPHEE